MLITICGSATFLNGMKALQSTLEQFGNEVNIPTMLPGQVNPEKSKPWQHETIGLASVDPHHSVWDGKEQSIRSYFQKVRNADKVLIANYDKNNIKGYIGGNVFLEMGIAFCFNIPIYILQLPDFCAISYGEEILGMRPTIINHDLSILY